MTSATHLTLREYQSIRSVGTQAAGAVFLNGFQEVLIDHATVSIVEPAYKDVLLP
jgi:hypothetical protein